MLAATRFLLATASAVAARLNGPAMEEIVAADESFYGSRLASRQALAWSNRQLLDELPRLPRPAAWHAIGGGGGLLPYNPIRRMFGALWDALAAVNATANHLTVTKVYDEILAGERRPDRNP